MRWNNWRLSEKIAVTFSIVLLVTVLILGNVTYVLMVRDNRNRTLDLMHNTITQMSKRVDSHLQEMERLSLTIFGNEIIQRVLRNRYPDNENVYDNNEVVYSLAQLSAPWSYIQGVYIFSNDGRLFKIARGASTSIDYTIQREPWYQVISVNKVENELNQKYGTGRAVSVKMNVRDEEEIRSAFREAVMSFGGVDVLVNNAGLATSSPFDQTSLEEWNLNLSVLGTGYFLVSREAFKLMKQQGRGGSMVFIGSKNSLYAGKDASAYSAVKVNSFEM